jgi:hypothetical protein
MGGDAVPQQLYGLFPLILEYLVTTPALLRALLLACRRWNKLVVCDGLWQEMYAADIGELEAWERLDSGQDSGQPVNWARQYRRVIALYHAQHKQALNGHKSFVECVGVSPDENTVASGSADHTVRLWPLRSRAGVRKTICRGHTDTVTCLQFVGEALISGSADGTLRAWDVSDGSLTGTMEGHTGGIAAFEVCAFSIPAVCCPAAV